MESTVSRVNLFPKIVTTYSEKLKRKKGLHVCV